MSLVVPAVLPTSRQDLDEKLELFSRFPSITRVQIDVVDGSFASPASWPYTTATELHDAVVHNQILPNQERIAYEIDLMCFDAPQAAEDWINLGATRLTFHAETATDLPRLLASAKKNYSAGVGFASSVISFGIALNIASDIALIEPILSEVDYVQYMGIARIGRQGQPIDERVFQKVGAFHKRYPDLPLQVDGGVSLDTAHRLLTLGVSSLIVGSAILRAEDPAAALAALEGFESPYGV